MVDKNQKNKETEMILDQFLEEMKKGNVSFEKTEDDEHDTLKRKPCPHRLCDGSMYRIVKNEKGHPRSIRCQCYHDVVKLRKQKNAHLPSEFWNASWEQLHEIDNLPPNKRIKLTYLKPKENPEERKIDGRIKDKSKIPPEAPGDYTKRMYDLIERKSLHAFGTGFTKTAISYLDAFPRIQSLNLLLLGDTGKGKTLMSALIANEFLKQNKKVRFIRMKALIDEVSENKKYVRALIRDMDLLILDELYQEYHTDSGWALTQIQDVIKGRQERKLSTIITTNAYPNELSEMYQGSLMSTFHGEFIMAALEGTTDLRVMFGRERHEDLDFLKDE